MEEPENIRSISLFNTWMWPLKGIRHFDTGDKVVSNRFGKFLYLQLNFSVRFMMRNSYADKKNLPDSVYHQYLMPMQSRSARWAAYSLAKSLVGENTHMEYLWQMRRHLINIPMHMLWGMNDKFVPAEVLLPRWKENFCDKKFTEIKNTGHFVQEEAGEQLTREISEFVSNIPVV